MVSISKDALRYYDEVGVLKPCRIDPENGYRYYHTDQVEVITQILEYKSYGFTLEEIKALLICDDAGILHAAFQRQYASLSEQKEKLTEVLTRLKNKMEAYDMEKKKVLIVADDESMRATLCDVLNKQSDHDYEKVYAAMGQEAIEKYSAEKPDLVLMGVVMPEAADGWDCANKLYGLDPAAKITLVTVKSSKVDLDIVELAPPPSKEVVNGILDELQSKAKDCDGIKKKILIVDDADFMRITLARILVKGGYEVVYAANGVEALEVYIAEKPDLVTMDIVMPEMNGIDCVKKLREIDPDVKIVFVTAVGNNEEFRKAMMEVGFCDVVLKPFKESDLLWSVSRVFEGYRAKMEFIPAEDLL